MNVQSPTFWAYFAGIVDGEGSIMLCQNGPRMAIAQNNRPFLEQLQSETGVGYIQTNAKNKTHLSAKECYLYSFGSEAMRDILPMIIPFMRIKKRKAELVLEYLYVTHRSHSRQPAMMQRREELTVLWGNDKGR